MLCCHNAFLISGSKCNQTKTHHINRLWNKYCPGQLFDIIIDNGFSTHFKAFKTVNNNCFKLSVSRLKNGGIYIIEDVSNFFSSSKRRYKIRKFLGLKENEYKVYVVNNFQEFNILKDNDKNVYSYTCENGNNHTDNLVIIHKL